MDTGLDVDHPDLGGDGNQAAPHSFPNARVVAGFDLVGDDYNADPESPTISRCRIRTPCRTTATATARTSPASSARTAGAAVAKGVAPGVTFGAYRVFGCAGSVTDDVMLAAMEPALADGMDVLNMSIGDAFNNWPARRPPRDRRARRCRHGRRRFDRQQRRRGSTRPAPRASATRSSASRPTTTRHVQQLVVHGLARRPGDPFGVAGSLAAAADLRQPADGEDRHDHDGGRRLRHAAPRPAP